MISCSRRVQPQRSEWVNDSTYMYSQPYYVNQQRSWFRVFFDNLFQPRQYYTIYTSPGTVQHVRTGRDASGRRGGFGHTGSFHPVIA